jgi:Uri superfamily endonuclease
MKQQDSPVLSSQNLAKGGAYILELNVEDRLSLQVGKLGQVDFEPGRYLYVGSAYGPGGIAARVTRHLKRKGRRLHWHIDYLSAVIGVQRAWCLPGGDECEIVSTLLTDQRTTTPFAGFGSSDCSRCSAHLLTSTSHQPLEKLLSSEVEVLEITADPNI